MQREIVASGVVQTDDAPVVCQGPKGSGKFQAHLWTYTSPLVDGVVYDFTPSREHEHVRAFLGEDYEGFLVGDGYRGYGTIAKASAAVTEAGCRVGEDVTALAPHRPGRAGFPHPVPRVTGSLAA